MVRFSPILHRKKWPKNFARVSRRLPRSNSPGASVVGGRTVVLFPQYSDGMGRDRKRQDVADGSWPDELVYCRPVFLRGITQPNLQFLCAGGNGRPTSRPVYRV